MLIPTTLSCNGSNIELGGMLRPFSQLFCYSGFQNLNQWPPGFQCPQTNAQQNASLHSLVAVHFIPIFGLGGVQSPLNMFPIAMPMNVGAPVTMDGLAQSSGLVVPGAIERALQGQVGDIHGPQGLPWGRPLVVNQPIEPQRQANRRFVGSNTNTI